MFEGFHDRTSVANFCHVWSRQISFHSGPHEHRQTAATALANSRLERAL
jgi:hypothetical protein